MAVRLPVQLQRELGLGDDEASLNKTFTDGGETGYIAVDATGTDPDGGAFELHYDMVQN